jgi:ribosomal protein L29
MKRQDLVKYQQMSPKDLQTEIGKLESQLVEFTMKKGMAQVKNVRLGKFIRHDIARLKSILTQLELSANQAALKEQA